jgi:hypothetical protein
LLAVVVEQEATVLVEKKHLKMHLTQQVETKVLVAMVVLVALAVMADLFKLDLALVAVLQAQDLVQMVQQIAEPTLPNPF